MPCSRESPQHLDTYLYLSLSAPSLVWFGGRCYPALPAITIRLGVLAGILYEHSPLTRSPHLVHRPGKRGLISLTCDQGK